jgi:hypothetical protein
MPLHETQTAISEWVRAPKGVAAALEEEDASSSQREAGSAKRRLENLICSDEALNASGRLEIYANAYFSRIHGVLRADYPALIALIGDVAFNDLVTSYLLVEPSRSPSLRYAGLRLADFVSNHEVMARMRERWPEAADLAAFEWARIDVFDAADGTVLTRELVSSLAPEKFAELFLCLGTWVRLRAFDHPVLQLWRAGTSSEVSGFEGASGEAHVVIWRQEEKVFHRSLDPLERAALAKLSRGSRFDDLCEWAASEVGEEAAPGQAAAWLERWLADGLLVVA